MSSQVNIRIPSAFAQKQKATTVDTTSSSAGEKQKRTNLMIFDSNNSKSSKNEPQANHFKDKYESDSEIRYSPALLQTFVIMKSSPKTREPLPG